VIGAVDNSNGSAIVYVKNLNAKDETRFSQACITLTNIVAETVNGVTTIRFTRAFGSGKYALLNDGINYMIASYRAVDDLGWHTASNHASQLWELNYATGAATRSIDAVYILRIIHGTIMLIGWGLGLPFGLLWARYARRIPNTMAKDIWFRVHMPNQYFFSAFVMVGVVIGYTQVAIGGGEHFTTQFHGVLGTCIWVLMVFQVIVAYFRPHKEAGKPVSPQRTAFELFHLWNGRIMALAAVAQIIEGMRVIGWFGDGNGGEAPAVLFIYCAVVGAVLLMVVVLEICNCRWETQKKKGEKLKPTT